MCEENLTEICREIPITFDDLAMSAELSIESSFALDISASALFFRHFFHIFHLLSAGESIEKPLLPSELLWTLSSLPFLLTKWFSLRTTHSPLD